MFYAFIFLTTEAKTISEKICKPGNQITMALLILHVEKT